jgi:hypothetical protein
MQRLFAVAAALTCLIFGGCNSTPASLEAVPTRSRLTGYTYGSGNVVATPPDETTAATASAVAVQSDSTSRGGYTYGSGN